MAVTRVLGDPRATAATSAGGTEVNGWASKETKKFSDKDGKVADIGRGETDTNIGYIALPNEDGNLTYIYPNAAQNGVIVSAAKP